MATLFDVIGWGSKNRLTKTEDWTDTGIWTQIGTVSITADNTLDPLGTNTADRIADTDAGLTSLVRQTIQPSVSEYVTFSVYLKPDTTTQSAIQLQHNITTDTVTATVNWSASPPTVTKSTVGTHAYSDVDIRAAANGFYRVSVTSIYKTGNTALRSIIQPATTSAATTAAVWAWGAQTEIGMFATSYQAIGASNGIPAPTGGGSTYRRIEDWASAVAVDGTNAHVGQLLDETYNLPANTVTFARTGTDNTTKFTRLAAFGSYEINTLTADDTPPTGGTWTMTINGQTATGLARNINAATLQSSLESLSNVAPGDVVCTATFGANLGVPNAIITLRWAGTFAGQNVAVSINTSGVTGGNPHVLGTSFEGGQGYDPITNTGPRVIVRWPTTGTNFGIKITESFAEIVGVGFFGDHQTRGTALSQTANGNEAEPVGNTMIWIDNVDATHLGSDAMIANCFVSIERGGGDVSGGNDHFFKAFYIGSSRGSGVDTTTFALRNCFYNCIVKGAGPRSTRGTDYGWYWGSFAESATNGTIVVGGCYNCIAYGCTGHGGLGNGFATRGVTTRVEFAPELMNCMAIDCAPERSYFGFWRRARYCISSDSIRPTQAKSDSNGVVIPGTTQTEIYITNKSGVSADTLFISPEHQDFRQKGGAPSSDGGLNLNSIYTGINGPGSNKDYTGFSRATSAETWDVGAYEGITIPPSAAVNTTTKTVGRGPTRDYPSIGALIADLPRSLYSAQQRYVATCYDDGVVDLIGNTIEAQYYNCITGPTYYVEIKADKNINPRTQRGYVCELKQDTDLASYHRAVIWITMPWFKMSGIMLRQAVVTTSVNPRVVELFADDCTLDALFLVFNDESFTSTSSVVGIIDIEGNRNLMTNCVLRGANTTGSGPSTGISLEQDVFDNQILHCDVYRIRGGTSTATSRGILVKQGSGDSRVSGCAVLETATSGSGGAFDFAMPNGVAVTSASGVNTTNPSTITRTSGNWLTDGYLVGRWIRGSGWSNAANNSDLQITAVAGGGTTTITVSGATLVTEASASGKQFQLVNVNIVDHCFSSDSSTGSGAGNQNSITAAQIWNNAASNDFRHHKTSLALNAGDKLGVIFSTDITGAPRLGPFDVGAYEGIITGPLLASPAPKDHHRLATLWEIQRNDGLVHFFCSANEPIDHLGQTFKPVGHTQDQARRMESALKEHNTTVLGAITSADITAENLAAGLYSGARIIERLVDWRYPWTTPVRTATFYIDTLEYDQDIWQAELVGPTIKLDQNAGELMGVDCEYELGDGDCQFDIKAVTQNNVSISSIVDARREFAATSMTGTGVTTDDYFGRGKLTVLSGLNAGLVFEVKTYVGSSKTIKLVDRAPFNFAVNDRFNLSPGCRLRYLLDCIAKFSNGINFGGRPWLEGPDLLFETPTR